MKHSHATVLAIFCTAMVEAAAALPSNDELLSRLDAAEQRWTWAEPRSYSYTVSVGTAFGSTTQYRVTVKDGSCSAKVRMRESRRYSLWKKSDSCQGARMTDLFKLVREYGTSPNIEVLGLFDQDFGSVVSILTIDYDISDSSSSIEVSEFKISHR